MKQFIIIAGTRPEIIKVAPIIREIKKQRLKLFFIHSGQHYDYLLSKQIINDLKLPKPKLSFKLKNSSPSSQLAEIITKLDKPLKKMKNSIMIVQGDTNTVVAGALAAIKNGIQVAHVEAGLRSYDWRMSEEHNRRMVDHISNFLFTPTEISKQNLINEKIYGKIFVTGNTVMDAVKEHLPLAEKKSKILSKIKFKKYIVATFHRAENVDNKKILTNIVSGLIKSNKPIVIPLHPRTRKNLIKFGLLKKLLSNSNIQILNPLGYLDFLILMKNSKFIITDSGGLQEEATSPEISKKVLILRISTERTEAVKAKMADILKLNSLDISCKISLEWDKKPKRFSKSPYGIGSSSKKIVNILRKL